MGIVIVFLLIGVSSYLLYRSCSDFESGSRTIGLNLKDGVRGATINAIGSSLPEFFTSLFFLFILQDINGLTTGLSTVLGSAIFNILIIPGVVIIILVRNNHDVLINKKLILRDSGILLVAQFMLLIFLIRGRDITVLESFFLFAVYLIYIYILSKGGIFHANISDRVDKEIRNDAWKKIFWGVIKISVWCLLLVSACEILFSGKFPSFLSFFDFDGIFSNIMFVALLFAAIASSIPDLFLSAFDARTGDVDDSLSNPIASNLFDICIAFGLPIFLYTAMKGDIRFDDMHNNIYEDIYSLVIIMIIITIVFLVSVLFSKRYSLLHAILFFILFIGFIFSLFYLDQVYQFFS